MDSSPRFGQLFYASFAKIGLRLVASAAALTSRQFFLDQVVRRHWDSYNPPRSGFRGVYLLHRPPEVVLCGWLYSEAGDDVGRSRAPYFLGYTLNTPLDACLLDALCLLLHRGPVIAPGRAAPPELPDLPAPNLWTYRAARPGLALGASLRTQLHSDLVAGRPLDLFAGIEDALLPVEFDARTGEQLIRALTRHVGPMAGVIVRQVIARSAAQPDPIRRAEQVCRELLAEVDDPQALRELRRELEGVLNLQSRSQ